ncbi:MAG: hypothetical protein WA210_14015 [Burkholderiaceae bacterium]
MKRRVFVTEYVGLSSRLEALAMAFLISEYFGHEVCLDWRDLDALHVVGARRRGRGVLGRLHSLKLKGDAFEGFDRIHQYTNINVRTHYGPDHLLRKVYLPTARRVKLRPDLIAVIRKTFEPYRDRPLVGVHIRRGDFPMIDPDVFDVNAFVWPAVPDWWYEYVMAQIKRNVPDVAFFVSCSGSLNSFPFLRGFDVFDLPAPSPYDYKEAGHAAARHPAADLFALGCCDTLIGSPCSTFSHYPANMLGRPTRILVPPAHPISRESPEFASLEMHGRGAGDWLVACRTGLGLQAVPDAGTLPITNGAFVDWM